MSCDIRQSGGATWCATCGLAWDTNDDDPRGALDCPNADTGVRAMAKIVAEAEKRGAAKRQAEIVARLRRITELQRYAGPNERAEWGISYVTQVACAAALEAATNVIEAMP